MTRLHPGHFALLTAALPFLCVHLSYLLAASHGHVPWCVPYWDSCTSISATGRELPEKILFKLLMMPAGMCGIVFWWLVRQWLRLRIDCNSRIVPLLGGVASGFLLLYVVALGESNEYRWARQTGIILFFSLSFLAQLLFLYRSSQHHALLDTGEQRVLRWQLRGAGVMLLIGIGSVLLDALHPRYDDMEDAVEWILMLGLVLQFASHYLLWRDGALQVQVTGDKPPAQ
ncbi:MAG: hypothetical protein ACO3PV_02700 [Pseudohongiellaceae bacterium]